MQALLLAGLDGMEEDQAPTTQQWALFYFSSAIILLLFPSIQGNVASSESFDGS
jgi:hypothetical protein